MNTDLSPSKSEPAGDQPAPVQSLRALIDLVTGRSFPAQFDLEDAGLAETLPFPFLGLVGQEEMKLALLIAVINPLVSGVLLVGPRGTGKTTAVRSLVDLLPYVKRSACYYGCLPEDIEAGGIDAVCPDCARKYGEGQSLTRIDRGRMVELPLNARLEDVIGSLDEHVPADQPARMKSGILKRADQNVLYIDEVNMLDDDIINAILDAAGQGIYSVRRGPISRTYRARFTLIGSMNPEEGSLRSQIMDRFGLRVFVHGLQSPQDRLEAYYRARAYRINPHATVARYASETELARTEIQAARDLLPKVSIPQEVETAGTQMIQRLGIASLRAEITLFEAVRALAAADGRETAGMSDLKAVAPLALRLRQSAFMIQYFQDQAQEEHRLEDAFQVVLDESVRSELEGKNAQEDGRNEDH